MPINAHLKKPGFNETYYRDKFNQKKAELEKQLYFNPGDLVLTKQIEFVDKLITEGDKSDEMGKKINWVSIWNTWEQKAFLPFQLYQD